MAIAEGRSPEACPERLRRARSLSVSLRYKSFASTHCQRPDDCSLTGFTNYNPNRNLTGIVNILIFTNQRLNISTAMLQGKSSQEGDHRW